jgi:hypothetical protein
MRTINRNRIAMTIHDANCNAIPICPGIQFDPPEGITDGENSIWPIIIGPDEIRENDGFKTISIPTIIGEQIIAAADIGSIIIRHPNGSTVNTAARIKIGDTIIPGIIESPISEGGFHDPHRNRSKTAQPASAGRCIGNRT